MGGSSCRSWRTRASHLLADDLPLSIQLVQLLLDVGGVRRLRLLLQVQPHLIDAVEAWLDGVDVIHQSLWGQRSGYRRSPHGLTGWASFPPCTAPTVSPEPQSLPERATPRSKTRPHPPSTSSRTSHRSGKTDALQDVRPHPVEVRLWAGPPSHLELQQLGHELLDPLCIVGEGGAQATPAS